MTPSKRFGLNLHTARRMKGMTQAQLASQVYLDRCAISRMETGHRYPRLDHVLEFADALGVKPRALLHGVAY